MFIYLITNKVNGKRYVGLTVKTLRKRIINHLCAQTCIGSALRKYGLDLFDLSIIDNAEDAKSLYEKEQHWIRFYGCKEPNGYNMTDGGEGTIGMKYSEESKRKISESAKGNKKWLGKIHTEESKRKMSIARKGKQPRLGCKHTEETKKKLSESHRNISEETRLRMRLAHVGNKNALGCTRSEEYKRKKSEFMKAKYTPHKPNGQFAKRVANEQSGDSNNTLTELSLC